MTAFSSGNVPAENLAIISWVLPQMKRTKMATRKEKTYPPESWARGRFFARSSTRNLGSMCFGTREGGHPGDSAGAADTVVNDALG